MYKGAFNSAYAENQDDVRASRIAWEAVKRNFEKRGNKWVKKKK